MTTRERRMSNPGKRERQARKRHRRGQIWSDIHGGWLKVGSRHFFRYIRASHLAVADTEKPGDGTKESARSTHPTLSE
jgi:hypothetical protein